MIYLLSDFVKEPVLKELAEEFCGRSREDAEKIVAPLAVRKCDATLLPNNSEQNSIYCRANAQRKLRQYKEWKELLDRPRQLMFHGDPVFEILGRQIRPRLMRFWHLLEFANTSPARLEFFHAW